MRAAQALALAVCVCFSLGATDPSSRFNDMSHRLMCTCGCAEILGECNHVGCPNSTGELNELRAAIAAGETDQQIKDAFVAKYGATVLAAPTAQGFDLVAWIAPFAVLAAGILGTVLLVRRWSLKMPTDGSAGIDLLDPLSANQASLNPDERALRERIRRETGGEGGS
jgi:cytochrome c-type biogenesis protein CcmH